EAICSIFVSCATCAVWAETNLGRDKGREGALLDEAHLDGCDSISTNCLLSMPLFGLGNEPGLARRWRDDGVLLRSTVVLGKKLRVSAGAAKPHPMIRASSMMDMAMVRDYNHHIARCILSIHPRRRSTPTMSALPRSIGARLLKPALR